MERDFPGAADAANLCYRLNSAHLVVGIHDRDECSLIGKCSTDIIGIDAAIAINGYIGSFEAKTLQVLAGVQHSMVFYRRGNQVVSLFLQGKRYTFNRQVIALGAAACKGDLGRTTAKQLSHLFASAVNGLHGTASQRVDTARVAILGGQVR